LAVVAIAFAPVLKPSSIYAKQPQSCFECADSGRRDGHLADRRARVVRCSATLLCTVTGCSISRRPQANLFNQVHDILGGLGL
jgi:hypothetical protein